MKKRKILYVIPFAALVLSGCTFQDGIDWLGKNIYEPVKNWIVNLFNPGKKDDPKPTPDPGPGPQPVDKVYTPDEVIALCDQAGSGKVVADLLKVEGVVGKGSSYGDYGWEGSFISTGTKTLVFGSASGFATEESLDGATIVLEGYAELYNGTYKIAYLPASASPTGSPYSPTILSVTQPGEKTVVSVESVTVDIEHSIVVGDKINKSNVTCLVKYDDDSQGEVAPTNLDYSTEVANPQAVLTAYVGEVSGTTTINVVEMPTYTPEEFVAVCDQAGSGKVVEGLLRVKGFAKDSSYSSQYKQWSGTFDIDGEQSVTFDSAKPDRDFGATLDNKLVVVEGYGELYNGVYKVGYLPANISPTGAKFSPFLVSAEVKDVTPESIVITSGNSVGIEQTLLLKASVRPVGSPQDVVWSIESGSEYATLDGSLLTGVAQGTVVVKAAVASNPEISAQMSITVGEAVDQLKAAYEAVLDGDTSEKTFSGVVVGLDGNSFYLQSGEYGMMVYNTPVENIALGKIVEVTSTLKVYSGLPETDSVASAEIKGDGVLPTPAEVASAADLGALKINVLANVQEAVFVTKTKNWDDSSKSIRFTFAIGSDEISVNFNKNGYDADKAAVLNAAVAGDKFVLGNLITNAYNPATTGSANQLTFAGQSSTVTKIEQPAKTIVGATITSHPETVALNGSIANSAVTVEVTYDDQTTGAGKVTAVTCDTQTAGPATATVTVEGYTPAEPLTFEVTVTDDVPPTPAYIDATMAKGSTSSYDDCTINGNFSIKMGTKNGGGNMTITVGANAKKLKFYAVAWKGEGGENYPISITGATVSPESFNPVANDVISGTAKAFTLDNVEQYLVEITLSGIQSETTLTLTTTKRALVWGAQYSLN